MIENPIYGGAYAYGKTAVAAGYDAAGVRVKIRRKPRVPTMMVRCGFGPTCWPIEHRSGNKKSDRIIIHADKVIEVCNPQGEDGGEVVRDARQHQAFAAKLTPGGGLFESGTKKSGDSGWFGSTR